MRKIKRKTRGQSLVEMALVLPILLLLVLTFIDLARGVYYYSTLGNAVREGARYASVRKLDTQTVRDEVESVVTGYSIRVAPDTVYICPYDGASCDPIPLYQEMFSDPDKQKICVENFGTAEEEIVCVLVVGEYEFDPVTPFLARILGSGNTITLTSESSMLLAPIARN
jgi:hypothetical protein